MSELIQTLSSALYMFTPRETALCHLISSKYRSRNSKFCGLGYNKIGHTLLCIAPSAIVQTCIWLKVEWVVRFGWIVGPLPRILVTGPGLHLLFLDTSIQINHCKSKVHCFFRLSFIITFHKNHQVPVKCMSIIGIFFVPAMIQTRQVERWVFLFELIVST